MKVTDFKVGEEILLTENIYFEEEYIYSEEPNYLPKGNKYLRLDKDNWFVLLNNGAIACLDFSFIIKLEEYYQNNIKPEETLVKSFNLNLEDIIYYNDFIKDYYEHLPKNKQQEFKDINEHSIGKGLESGLFTDFPIIASTIAGDLKTPDIVFEKYKKNNNEVIFKFENNEYCVDYIDREYKKGKEYYFDNYKDAKEKYEKIKSEL